jgi:hypothetical protein
MLALRQTAIANVRNAVKMALRALAVKAGPR